MQSYKLAAFTRGWVVGDFLPSLINSKDIEVAVQNFEAGDREPNHLHKIAKEITIIARGSCIINEQLFNEGDIVVIAPGEAASFEALQNTVTVVIKTPSVPSDKYFLDGQ